VLSFEFVCVQVWQKLQEYGDQPHARELLLGSLLRVVDASMWSDSSVSASPWVLKEAAAARRRMGDGKGSAQEVSHRQSLESLRHFAFWALGEYVHLWDSEELFRQGHAVDASGLSLRSVMFDFTAPPALANIGVGNTGGFNSFFDTPAVAAPSAAEPREVGEAPFLVRVIISLFHALQIESEHMVSVCLISLFKIAMWCPRDKESPVRDMIRSEFLEISASAFGITHAFTASDLAGELDLFRSSVAADHRSPLTALDRMGLGHMVELPGGSEVAEYSTCHYGARKWGDAWHSSAICREALLYSLALESLVVAKNPPRISTLEEMQAKATAAVDASHDDIGGDLFGVTRQASFDLLGDIIDMPVVEAAPMIDTSVSLLDSGGDLLGGGGGGEEESNFVVDGAELKKHMYLLTRLVHS
jgi:hypothetical protein